MKRLDAVLYKIVAAAFILSCAASAAFLFISSAPSVTLEVVNGDRVERRIPIDRDSPDAALFIVSDDKGSNAFIIDGGLVRMVSSDCYGGDCLRMPAARGVGDVIVCLPHRLILRIVGEGEGRKLDGVSY